jgi:hypothetical protein
VRLRQRSYRRRPTQYSDHARAAVGQHDAVALVESKPRLGRHLSSLRNVRPLSELGRLPQWRQVTVISVQGAAAGTQGRRMISPPLSVTGSLGHSFKNAQSSTKSVASMCAIRSGLPVIDSAAT